MEDKTVYFIKPYSKFSLNLRELWLYRELFFFFTWRDIKVKYKQTILGFIWAVLQPFLMMLIFTFFFSRTLQISTNGIPAPIFYYSGLMLWNLFSSGLSSAGNSMVSNAQIIKKIYFPRLIIPISSVLVSLFDFLMALSVFILMLLYYEITDANFRINYLAFLGFTVLSILISVLTTFGFGSLLAALNVQYRDFRYIIPFLIQFLLFVTPVIYPISILSDHPFVQYLLAINPMTGAISLGRLAFTNDIDWITVGISLSSMLLILTLGIYVFRRMEAYFADIA